MYAKINQIGSIGTILSVIIKEEGFDQLGQVDKSSAISRTDKPGFYIIVWCLKSCLGYLLQIKNFVLFIKRREVPPGFQFHCVTQTLTIVFCVRPMLYLFCRG